MPSDVPGYMADQGLVDIYVETAPPSSIEPTSPVELHTISSHHVDEKEGVWVSPTQDSFGWEEEEQLSEEEYWNLNPLLASADRAGISVFLARNPGFIVFFGSQSV